MFSSALFLEEQKPNNSYFGGLCYVTVQPGRGDTRWHSWLIHCSTSRKVAVSIPDGVIAIFH